MTAAACETCGETWAYDRARCPSCGGTDFASTELGEGVVVATTVSRVTPPDVREPNHLAIARFGDVQVTAQVADEELEAGDAVALRGDCELRDGERGPRLEAV